AAAYPDETRGALGIVTLWNVEQQKNPVVMAQINHGVGMLFRPRVFTAIAKGAKGIGFWKDDIDGGSQGSDAIPIENQPWWSDLPNIRNEIDQLLPIIRMPHWTDWSLSSNNSLTDFGTRDYQGKGAAQSVTFTITSLPYAATAVRNFFTNEIEAQISSNQFTVSIPAYGSKVYVLENNIEEMLVLKLLCNESGGSTAYDCSKFASNGTLCGNASLASGVLSLDGSGDYVNCGKKSTLEMGKLDMSIVARVKISSAQAGTYAGIIAKGAGQTSETGYAFVYRTDTQKMTLIVSNGSSRPFLYAPTAFNMKDDAWHTVGVSLDRDGNAEFYIDGVSKGTASASSLASSDITNTSLDLTAGCWGSGNYLNGQTDNIRIYKKALSATEMSDLAGNITFDAQLNETSGTAAYDSSINSSNGALYGNAALGGGILTLDGNGDYADFAHPSTLEMGTGNMTIIARIKLAATQNTYTGIATKGGGSSSDTGYALFYYPSLGQLVMRLANGTTNLWLNSNNSLALNDNNWHTVGVSLDRAGNAAFYVDGAAVGTESASSLSGSDITNTTQNMLLGSWVRSHYLNGNMDYVKIYKRALSSTEMGNMTR
ncbi:MAG: LamG domain-containing protein, partial [Victivallaceae bacterium]